MITETKPLNHELDQEVSVSGEHLAAYVINKLRSPTIPEINVFENLSSNAGSDEQHWEYITRRLAVTNYLSDNNLNTENENVLALNLLQKHGITRDNYLEFFDGPLSASQLIAAYEITRTNKNNVATEGYRAA